MQPPTLHRASVTPWASPPDPPPCMHWARRRTSRQTTSLRSACWQRCVHACVGGRDDGLRRGKQHGASAMVEPRVSTDPRANVRRLQRPRASAAKAWGVFNILLALLSCAGCVRACPRVRVCACMLEASTGGWEGRGRLRHGPNTHPLGSARCGSGAEVLASAAACRLRLLLAASAFSFPPLPHSWRL